MRFDIGIYVRDEVPCSPEVLVVHDGWTTDVRDECLYLVSVSSSHSSIPPSIY